MLDFHVLYSYLNLNKSITYFHLKNYLACQYLNLGPPEFQADALPIELSRLGLFQGRVTEVRNAIQQIHH